MKTIFHNLLEVSVDSSRQNIDKSYNKLVKENHSNKDIIKELKIAYDILVDENKLQTYYSKLNDYYKSPLSISIGKMSLNSERENTYEQTNYLIQKYKETHLDGDKNEAFDFNIYPEKNNICICKQCESDFDDFKKDFNKNSDKTLVTMKHPQSCLWFDYFLKKIRNICPNAIITRKK